VLQRTRNARCPLGSNAIYGVELTDGARTAANERAKRGHYFPHIGWKYRAATD